MSYNNTTFLNRASRYNIMPLKGVKVLELAGLAPVPFCGAILSDFGASVIRIDKPSSSVGFIQTDNVGNGKRSIALNLKHKDGIKIFRKLSDDSDVILEPFRKGVMEKLQLGPNDLMRTNKRLIYARLTGFGQQGPYSNMAGHDINFVSLSGLLSLFGRANEKPTPPVNFAADFAGGSLICAFGILLALLERTTSNVGQVIDASMVQGCAYVGSWLFRSQQMSGLWGNERGRNLLDTGSHFYDTYETKDKKYMSVGAVEPHFYSVLLEKLKLSKDDVPQFDCFEENREKIADIFKRKTQKEWCDIFDGTDACVTPVLSLTEAPHHPHNKESKTFTVTAEGIIPNPAPRLSRTPGVSVSTRPNPSSGENTVEILSELHYNPEEISVLLSNGIVEQADSRSNL